MPEDLYLIEGDPQSFDDSVFSVDELEKAVVVKIADRQWRYSRFPSLPLFGRAARENRIETLHAERESLSERFATLSFDVQKTQRLHQAFSRFIGSHLAVAFEDDPEEEIRKLNSRRGELERALSAHESDNQQNRVQVRAGEEGVSALDRLLPRLNLLADDTLADRVDEIRNVWTKRRKPRALFSSTVTSWRSWSLLFRCCRAMRSSLEQLKEDYAYAQQNPARCASAGLPWRKLCSAGPTSATPIRRKCSAATAISTRSCASVWSRRSPNAAARATRCVPMRRSLVSTIRCWPR